MIRPGSSYFTMPLRMTLVPSSVLPEPALPQMSVGRPAGRPPPVTSSSPGTPVSTLAIPRSRPRRWFIPLASLKASVRAGKPEEAATGKNFSQARLVRASGAHVAPGVDGDRLPGQMGGLERGEEEDPAHHVLDLGDAAERRRFADLVEPGPAAHGHHSLAGRRARRERVHGHAVRS